MTVLLVCDSRLVGDRLVDRLSKLAGVTIIDRMRNGEDALRRITAEPPEVVIVDVHLAGGAGMEVIRRVKRLKTPPLVVAVSTSSQPQDHRQSMKEGADFCIQLPEEIDNLAELLERVE